MSSQYIAPIAERIDMSQPTALNMGFAIAHNAIPMTAPMIIATALTLETTQSFKHGYRNVIVLKKMTFPNDKVLTIELSEKQISGRTISLDIDYEDVLYADSFNSCLMMEE